MKIGRRVYSNTYPGAGRRPSFTGASEPANKFGLDIATNIRLLPLREAAGPAQSTRSRMFHFRCPPGSPARKERRVETLHPHCAGLDVHKDSVAADVRHWDNGNVRQEVRTFGTTTRELLAMGDWFAAEGVTHVAMESTGVFWKPVWNLLEGRFELMLVNAKHIKHVPGRKTDVLDCQWIAQLLQHGLLRPSFVPDRPQRDLRDLTRQRAQLSGEKARAANRIQKILEDANIKLASVASDVLGVSGRQMIQALIDGQQDPNAMADFARRRMREKIPLLREALTGKVTEHHRFMLGQLLDHVEYLERQIEQYSQRIEQVLRPFERAAVEVLDTIPGFDARSAQCLLAEIGTDMARFPTPHSLACWAGMCPGNRESAGKRKSGKSREGDRWLKRVLSQTAWAASRTKRTYLSSQYHRLAGRRGRKRAIVAVGHSQLICAYHMLHGGLEYQDLGENYFANVHTKRQTQYHVERLRRLGYQVTLAQAVPA